MGQNQTSVHLKYLFIKKRATQKFLGKKSKSRASKVKFRKNVHLKNFWTQFKNVHCQGPCSSRRGVTEEAPAVGFCLGIGLFGSYNSD